MNQRKKEFSKTVIQKIKQLEIFTRRLLNGALVGDSRSAIKGTGFEFDQIREYDCGDDIRFIDWKASARTNKLLVKQYIEERNRTVFLAVDVSRSSIFGSYGANKYERIAELAGVLALVAQHGKDQVGLVLFSDRICEYIPPGNSLHHIHYVLEKLLEYNSQETKTNISCVLQHLLTIKKNNAIVFLISDFIDDFLEKYLAQAARKFDLIVVRCLDAHEKMMPSVGFITVEDIETGELVDLDLRKKRNNNVAHFLVTRLNDQNKLFKKYGVECLDIMSAKHDYLIDMVRFFRRRMMY